MQNVRLTRVGEVWNTSTFVPVYDTFASGYLASLTPAVSISFPFPQLFKGAAGTFMLTASGLYTVTEGTNFTVSRVATYNGLSENAAKSITASTSWHFADLGNSYMFTNGTCSIVKTNRDAMFGGTSKVFIFDTPTVGSCCEHKGRLVLGGFTSSNFEHDAWEVFNKNLFDLGIGLAAVTQPGTNYIWWSQIGSGTFFLFYPNDYIYGILGTGEQEYSSDSPMIWDMFKRGEMGFMPMDWQGTVLRVLPLGNSIVVYGTNGVSLATRSANTYGQRTVYGYGIASKSAACSDGKKHVFIDAAGNLCVLDETSATSLGFKEYFSAMLGTEIMVSYDPIEEDFIISNSTKSYTFHGGKVFGTSYMVSSVVTYTSKTYGIYSHADVLGMNTKDYAILVTDTIVPSPYGHSKLNRVIVSTVNTSAVEVAVYWRMTRGASWSSTVYRAINYEGAAYFPITALEFKIVIRCKDYTKVDFNDITLQFTPYDKRMIRSQYEQEG